MTPMRRYPAAMKQIVSIFHRIMALGEGRHDSGRRVARQLPARRQRASGNRAASSPQRASLVHERDPVTEMVRRRKSAGRQPAAE